MEENTKPKAAIIVDANPETGNVNIGVDVDKDGKTDITLNTVIKNKTFWIIISAILGIIIITKASGIW